MTACRYKVRAFDRALEVLRTLNQFNGLNASEISRMVQLPRPTVLRILRTLEEDGYVVRSDADSLFRATIRVRELSCGYRPTGWLDCIARPFLARIGEDCLWPLAVVRMRGDRLVVEALTDHASPMFAQRHSAGHEVSPSLSATALLFVAFAEPAVREQWLQHALSDGRDFVEQNGWNAAMVSEAIEAAREQDFTLLRLPTHTSVSLPVRVDGQMRCALNLRMSEAAGHSRDYVFEQIAWLASQASLLAQEIAAFEAGLPSGGEPQRRIAIEAVPARPAAPSRAQLAERLPADL